MSKNLKDFYDEYELEDDYEVESKKSKEKGENCGKGKKPQWRADRKKAKQFKEKSQS